MINSIHFFNTEVKKPKIFGSTWPEEEIQALDVCKPIHSAEELAAFYVEKTLESWGIWTNNMVGTWGDAQVTMGFNPEWSIFR